jgi:hypothetical protein
MLLSLRKQVLLRNFPPLYFSSLLYTLRAQLSYFLQYSLLYFQSGASDSVMNGEEGQENGHDSSSVNEPPRKKARKKWWCVSLYITVWLWLVELCISSVNHEIALCFPWKMMQQKRELLCVKPSEVQYISVIRFFFNLESSHISTEWVLFQHVCYFCFTKNTISVLWHCVVK